MFRKSIFFIFSIILIYSQRKSSCNVKEKMNQQQNDLKANHEKIMKVLNFKESDIDKLSKNDLDKYQKEIKKVLSFYHEALNGFDSKEKKIYSWILLDVDKLTFVLKKLKEKQSFSES